MVNPLERLKSLCVRDVMTREVVTVSVDQTMAEAATELRHRDVAWAPVIDEMGRCAGVLSATDFLKKEETTDVESAEHALRPGSEGRPLHIESVPTERVGTYMTQGVQSVSPEVAVLMAARMMCSEHIHRLLVLDHQERPIGVVSTMDIVSALLNAIEESKM